MAADDLRGDVLGSLRRRPSRGQAPRLRGSASTDRQSGGFVTPELAATRGGAYLGGRALVAPRSWSTPRTDRPLTERPNRSQPRSQDDGRRPGERPMTHAPLRTSCSSRLAAAAHAPQDRGETSEWRSEPKPPKPGPVAARPSETTEDLYGLGYQAGVEVIRRAQRPVRCVRASSPRTSPSCSWPTRVRSRCPGTQHHMPGGLWSRSSWRRVARSSWDRCPRPRPRPRPCGRFSIPPGRKGSRLPRCSPGTAARATLWRWRFVTFYCTQLTCAR